MKNVPGLFVLILFAVNLFAQKESFDLTSYLAPKGWNKEVKKNSYTSFTSTNQQTKSYCQIFIMLSTGSKGSIKKDFESEWQTLIAKQYGVTDAPQLTDPLTDGGWQIKSGMASFAFNNGTSTALLTTMTGYNKAVSIVSVTNSPDYLPAIQQFLESVEMKTVTNQPDNNQYQNNQSVSTRANRGFAYTTTNFNDGWVSTEQEDWVQVTKGNIKVLIHYAKEGTTIASDPEPHVSNAWNILVAPRYSNLRNFKVASPSLDSQRAYLGAGDATDNKTGRQVYVALFRKGNSGWVEFIAPDKNTFVREFGTDVNNIGWDASSDIWNPLIKMFNCNKFAVSASDLPGNWKSSSGAGIEYYNVYTGNNMGMASASSTTEFIFQQDGTYTSIYKGVDGFNGNNRYAGETLHGKAIVSDWQIQLTNRFNGATETFASQFEAVKGGRILHMYRGNIEELHLFRTK